MHVPRALLLFAIVLGLAAVAASLSRSGDEGDSPPPRSADNETRTETSPTLAPGDAETQPAAAPETLAFMVEDPRRRGLEAGRAATVEVLVDEPGQVSIPDLGLTAAGEPVTPARFDVLVPEEGRYPIVFTPATRDEELPAGTLVVTAPTG